MAAEWAGFETVGQCEFADFPTKVLEKQWPDVPRWRDVRTLTVESFRERTGLETVDCISGGFPCQPHSIAGKRKASSDERDLWPEMRRVISEIKPRWVVAENVRGLLSSEDGRFFRGILRDFADMGFNVGWCTYRAADVGAIHARERVAVIAYSNSGAIFTLGKCGTHKQEHQNAKKWSEDWNEFELGLGIMAPEKWWNKRETPRPLFLGNDNGVSDWLDRWHCTGNAVSPPQFYPIFKAIAELEKT